MRSSVSERVWANTMLSYAKSVVYSQDHSQPGELQRRGFKPSQLYAPAYSSK